MDINNIIAQLKEGINNREYEYRCCECVFGSLYELRKHLFECHPLEYRQIKRYFKRVKPEQLTKEERSISIKNSLLVKEKAQRLEEDYSRQPSAWIIYHHNGPKNR